MLQFLYTFFVLVQNTHCSFNEHVCLCICLFYLFLQGYLETQNLILLWEFIDVLSKLLEWSTHLWKLHDFPLSCWQVLKTRGVMRIRRVGVKRKEWTDFLRTSDAIFLHSSPARRVTRRLAAPWQCRGQEVNRHVVHGELKLIETRRRMTRSKVKVTQQQGRHRWRAAHFLRQTVVINQIPTAERKQFNPQHVVAGIDTNWGAYKLVSLQDPSFKLELALTQNRIIIVQ